MFVTEDEIINVLAVNVPSTVKSPVVTSDPVILISLVVEKYEPVCLNIPALPKLSNEFFNVLPTY